MSGGGDDAFPSLNPRAVLGASSAAAPPLKSPRRVMSDFDLAGKIIAFDLWFINRKAFISRRGEQPIIKVRVAANRCKARQVLNRRKIKTGAGRPEERP